jgi:monoamine oxidase
MKDIIIIGAGPSGLAAADYLASNNTDIRVTVLEASQRVGGRTLSIELSSQKNIIVDLGGQWVGSDQKILRQYCSELGLQLHPQYNTGKRVLDLDTIIRTYTGLIPNVSILVLIDAQLALLVFSILQFFLWLGGITRPLGYFSKFLDSLSVDDYSRSYMYTIGGRALVSIVVQGLFGCEAKELSVLALCRYALASGGLEKMTESGPNSLQAFTIIGGAMQVSEKLAKRAEQKGVRILYSHLVYSIEERRGSIDDGIYIRCENGAEFFVSRIILAIPPPIARSIKFVPSLSLLKETLMRESTMGGIIKSIAVYTTAFWRDQGYSGEVICDTTINPTISPVFNVFDNCLPNPITGELIPMLVIFINGERAREFSTRPAKERKECVLKQLARFFTNDLALTPIEYLEKDWVSDPFTKGCPIASYGRNVLSQTGGLQTLTQSEWGKKLIWASTETSHISTGFIDGALQAGINAANESIKGL